MLEAAGFTEIALKGPDGTRAVRPRRPPDDRRGGLDQPGGREKIAPVDEFSVSRRRAGDAIVVAPAGEIDLATVDVLEAEIEAALGEDGARSCSTCAR